MAGFSHFCRTNSKHFALLSRSVLSGGVSGPNVPFLTALVRHGSASSGQTPLSKDRYPNLSRGKFASLQDRDIQFFQGALEPSRVIQDETEVEPFNIDWIKSVRGYSSCVLKPKTTEEVSAILRYCNERNLAVCPQGGNTGLVGGAVPVFDEIVLCTSLMKDIISFDPMSGVLVCQSGCVLETLESHVEEQGYMMPIDLGAKGSCHIGGNVSTNAGGIRLLRYGNMHGAVLGIEAVLANGEVVDCLSTLKKDNTGYHLKHLFIGSEGTLGVVTKVSIHCPSRPANSSVAYLGLPSFENVLEVFKLAKKELGEILSSCEMMDADSAHSVHTLGLRLPIKPHNFYMLIEAAGSNPSHDQEKLSIFFEKAFERGLVQDGTLVKEPSHMANIWACRERIAESMLKDGYAYKYDLSLPYSQYYNIVLEMRKLLPKERVLKVCGYGHVGDGNMHFNVTSKEFDAELLDMIEPAIFELTAKYGGSVSAEHGIGLRKIDFIQYSKSQAALSMMRQLKTLMDPKGILNPYKVLPPA